MRTVYISFIMLLTIASLALASEDYRFSWTSEQAPSLKNPKIQALVGSLPDSINQIKNVKAGVDLDKDGKQEFMVPVWHIEDGVNRRSVFVFETSGDDAYDMVWSYQFPGIADQFVTVDVSDLDGDGNLEILAVNVRAEGDDDAGPNLYVFENVGDDDYGSGPAVTWDLGSAGRDVVRVAKAADLDGDGKEEVVLTSFLTQPSIVVASVSDFSLPVWTTEFVNNDIGGSSPDIAAIGIGDMDGDGTPEVVMSEGATEQLVVLEATAANTYSQYTAAVPASGKTVSVHGIDLADANGDGQDEAFFANLQGAVWVVASDDVSTLDSTDIHLIADTEEQWLETGIGDFSGRGLDFVIAASNASKAVDYQYVAGPGGDVTDAGSYSATTLVDVDDFATIVPGGLRVYGLDIGDDMDGDGLQEIVFSRGSTRGGADAPAIFILEFESGFTHPMAGALPDSINQIKNVKAGVDLDKDGKQEFMVPVWHIEDGVNRRSVFVFETSGDDAYDMVWSYQFPGIADQFVTVDVSDLDGDGNLEILAVNVRAEGDDDAGPNLYVFENVGDDDYGSGPAVTWDLGSEGRDVVRVAKAADLDGDGKEEVVLTSFLTQPSIVVASVSDFSLPVWTSEFVNNDIGGSSPDIAAIGIGDMDGDGTPEVVMSEGATEQLVVLEATAANTYSQYTAAVPASGKTVSVHGIDLADANGDGQDEAFFANLQGAVWVVTSDDVSTLDSTDIHLIEDTEEQWLETGIGDFSGRGLDFVIAASNASKAVDYQYVAGPGGDVTDAGSYSTTTLVDVDDFATIVPGGLRVYGLDIGDDMDGDGLQEIVFSRGSTRGGADAAAIFILELEPIFTHPMADALPDSINQIKNVKAGVDLDKDGKQEFMVPVWHIEDGVNRRSVFVFENSGDDAYDMVWSYQFPGIADQFVTVDVSDLDGDGNLEILAVNVRAEGDDDAGPNLYVFENVGDDDYGSGPAVTWDLGSEGRDVVRVAKAADLDGDGKEEVVLTSFLTQPSIVVASVSDFSLPVWTTEFVNNDIGGSSPDIAAIGIGDMDGDGTPEVVMSEGATEQLVVLEATAANTYSQYTAAVPASGKTVSVHGIDLADANGDGQDEAFFANLQGAVWVVASDDVSTLDSTDIHLIADTEEQWLETGIGDFSGRGLDFVIAASNASKAVDYQYVAGPGGDVTDAGSYSATTVFDVDYFANTVPGGLRVYGLDIGNDMDGDGLQEIVFSRGSTRGGADAPAIFILEPDQVFGPTDILDDIYGVPTTMGLRQNYPNPFNPSTTIAYDISKPSQVSLSIYDVLGRKVVTLVNEFQNSRSYKIVWDARDTKGKNVASGIYIYRLKTDFGTFSKRMNYIR